MKRKFSFDIPKLVGRLEAFAHPPRYATALC